MFINFLSLGKRGKGGKEEIAADGERKHTLPQRCPPGKAPADHSSCASGHLCPTAAAGQRGLYQQTEPGLKAEHARFQLGNPTLVTELL